MTFGYTYHEKNGNLVEGEIAAPCREDAFQQLRTQGIHPMRMWEAEAAAPGAGAVEPKPKLRWWAVAAAVFAVGLIVGGTVWLATRRPSAEPTVIQDGGRTARRSVVESNVVALQSDRRVAVARPRQQLPQVGTNGAVRAVNEVFAHASEVLLAAYAEPGRDVPPVSNAVWTESFEDDFYEAMDAPVWLSPDDDRRTAALKRVVAGLKEDASARLASGQTVHEVVEFFQTRQRMEAGWRVRILEQVRRGEISVAEANAQLRTLAFEEIAER